jgi:hypothetical protein
MIRLFLASIAVVSALAMVPKAVEAQKETPKKGALPKFNQVYVKIILPIDPATRGKDQPVVESWIAEELKKRGLSKFAAATAWVPLSLERQEATMVWNATLDREGYCPVGAQISERADGRIKVLVDGWAPKPGVGVTVSLTDEPGSRAIEAVEQAKTEQGLPFLAVLIGPPLEPAASTDDKK